MTTATPPSETVRNLQHVMTTAIWREALAIKRRNQAALKHASDQRRATNERLLELADNWRSDRRAALLDR
jgi:hypothetical protein